MQESHFDVYIATKKIIKNEAEVVNSVNQRLMLGGRTGVETKNSQGHLRYIN